jgi:DNA invertase Pin-like site-specific DNA recombinase
MKKVVLFTRVSTCLQDCKRQVKLLTEYCNTQNFQIEKVFCEKISGAKKNNERPVLLEMLQYIKNNNIDCVMFTELSRLGRNYNECNKLISLLIDEKINAYFLSQNMYLQDDKGNTNALTQFILNVFLLGANMEREYINERTRTGRKLSKIKQGRPKGTTKDIAESKNYNKVCDLLNKGVSVRQIAGALNISPTTVQKIRNSIKCK